MQTTQAFVGRETEIAALGECFGAVADGTPDVLVIEGEGGIGKTTLAERFLALHPEARVLRASGDETERGVSFAIIDQLLRSAGIDTADALGATQHLTVGLELLDRLGAADEPRRTVVVDRRRPPRRCRLAAGAAVLRAPAGRERDAVRAGPPRLRVRGAGRRAGSSSRARRSSGHNR